MGAAVALVLLVSPEAASLAGAQVRYKDGEGIVHWVDSLEQVPPEFRAGAVGRATPPAGAPGAEPQDRTGEAASRPAERAGDSAEPGELVGPACDAAVRALAARQHGEFTRYDVRRELGEACAQQALATMRRGADVIRRCSDRIETALKNSPAVEVTKAELLAAAGPGCERAVDDIWDKLRKAQ